ncbi:MAG: D-alanine--D-alanine ligase family protein [Eubacteriales bacterium]|nr:D-alanine--D-alanine ligase family protein [Eubacteriales bacterium]
MKIKVAVLFGGKSTEHEISIISALQAVQSIDREKYEIIPVYMTKEETFYTGEGVEEIENYKDIPALLKKATQTIWIREGKKVNLYRFPMKKFGNNLLHEVDLVFPIVHGTNVEDGALQGFLQTLGLPYVGCDVCASALGMNKYAMKPILKDHGIPVLDCALYTWKDYEDAPALGSRIEEKFSYPVIVKPINLGSSIGIKKAANREELTDALDLAFEFSRTILVEPAITQLREINCAVLGDYESAEASECEEPLNAEDILTFEDKYMSGGKGGAKGGKISGGGKSGMASLQRRIPADLTKEQRDEIRRMAVETFQALGCSGVSRIDFMMDQESGKIYVNEINTIPGSLSFYLWEPLGKSYRQLLDDLIGLALKRQREEEKLVFTFDSNVLAGVKLGGGAKGAKGAKLS